MISEHERLEMCRKDMREPKTEEDRKREAVLIIPFGLPEKPVRTGDHVEAYGKTWTVVEPKEPK